MDLDFTRGQYRRIYSGCVFGRRINSVSDFAARIFWHLVAAVDDFGNHNWSPVLVRHQLVPLLQRTDDEIVRAMTELENARLVVRYTHRGEPLCHVVGHLELQPSAQNGRRARRFPPCAAESGDFAVSDSDTSSEDAPPVNPGESRGIQGNPVFPGESGGHNNNNNNNNNNQQQQIASLSPPSGPIPAVSMGKPAAAAAEIKKSETPEPSEPEIRSRERPLDGKVRRIVTGLQLAAANIGVPPDAFSLAVAEFPDADWPAIICRADAARSDRGLTNPAGYLRRLAQSGVTPAQPSDKMTEKDRLSRLRSVSREASALASVQYGAPPDFEPFSEAWRCRWPGVSAQVRDQVAKCVLDATAKFKRDHPPPSQRPRPG